MKRYRINLISRDNQKFQYECWGESEDDAREKALQRIVDIWYDMYEYKVTSIKMLP